MSGLLGGFGSLVGGLSSLIGGLTNQNNQTVNGFGGLSGIDMSMLDQAMGLGTEAIHNRYAQLGLGVPDGDPATAAAGGTSLNYAGPSTMEMQDIGGLQSLVNANAGQLFNQNQTNPAISGTPANQAQNINQLGQLQSNAGFNAGLGSGGTSPNQNVTTGTSPTDTTGIG